MTKRVLLHVGTPKTGTSYLQDVLFRNRPALAEHGILYPADRFDAHFLAALDLMRLPWGGLETEAVGAWDRLAERGPRAGTAPRSSATRSSRPPPARRSGGRWSRWATTTAPRSTWCSRCATWSARSRPSGRRTSSTAASISYARFLEEIRDPARDSRIATWFWAVQEVPDILDRWGHDLPPERIHLVTVPPPGGPPALLWQRFSQALGLDGLDLDLEAERANPSLGVPETALLRRINQAANRRARPAGLPAAGARAARPPDAVAPHRLPAAGAAARTCTRGRRTLAAPWVDEIKQRGYDVVGDLADLAGPPPLRGLGRPGPPAREAGRGRGAWTRSRRCCWRTPGCGTPRSGCAGELHEAHLALERSYLRPTYRLREKIVRRLQAGRDRPASC